MFKKLNIQSTLLLSFMSIVLIGVAALAFNIYNVTRTRAATNELIKTTDQMTTLRNFQGAMIMAELSERNFVLTGNKKFLERREKSEKAARMSLQAALSEAENAELRDAIQSLQGDLAGEEHFPQVVALYNAGEKEAAVQRLQELSAELGPKIEKHVKGILAIGQGDLAAEIRAADDQARLAILVSVISVALSIVVGLGVGFFLAHAISRTLTIPLAQLRDAAEKVSMGDLDVNVPTDARGEIGDLAAAFQRMVTSVRFLSLEEEQPEPALQS